MKLYDAINGFNRPTHDEIRENLDPLSPQHDAARVAYHTTQHLTLVRCIGGWLVLKPTTGCPQGSSAACQVFNSVYGTPLEEFQCGLYSINPELEGFTIVGGIRGQDFNDCKVQCGSTSFVDDVASKSAAPTANGLLDRMNMTDELVEHKLAEHNLKQNETKSVSLCYFAGSNSALESHAWCQDNLHNITMEARYLGPHLSFRGSMAKEIELRIAAANNAWQAFFSFLVCRTDIGIQRVIIRGMVASTLFSGLMIAVLSG